MLKGQKIVVVMPAYNAEATLAQTYHELPRPLVDEVILVDDCSNDQTADRARELGINHVIRHEQNLGYGGNQKTCYRRALEVGADIVIMIHPDYQYTPKLCTSMVSMIAEGLFDCVLASRILGTGALRGGMPKYKYVANRLLTLFQNVMISHKLSEYHTGYRVYSRRVLEKLPLDNNSDDFVFDNQVLAQIIYAGYRIGEVTCPTRYAPDSSSISFARSMRYGIGVVNTSLAFRAHRWKLHASPLFSPLDGQAKSTGS